MATAKQIEANQRNAQKSTGPKTADGKAVVRQNALKHGATASTVVIPYLENDDDWEAHRQGTIESLSPQGHLETVLAERVAMLLWRLGRATRFERETIAARQEGLEAEHFRNNKEFPNFAAIQDKLKHWQDVRKLALTLPRLKESRELDTELCAQIFDIALTRVDEADPAEVLKDDVPEEIALQDFDEWTAGLLRKALADIGKQTDLEKWETPWTIEELLDVVIATAETAISLLETKIADATKAIARKRREHLLSDEDTMNRVSRYEAQLERSVYKTLHELQRLQAARQGMPVMPPAMVDVNLAISSGA